MRVRCVVGLIVVGAVDGVTVGGRVEAAGGESDDSTPGVLDTSAVKTRLFAISLMCEFKEPS